MFVQQTLGELNDYFLKRSQRPGSGVYFYRICGYNESVGQFLKRYYEAAARTGVVIEGRIPNPDERSLGYYEEVMGLDFRMDEAFISMSLRKWLPRINAYQREQTAGALYAILAQMRQEGKNDHMLKNAYIKFMCWLYYRFERIVSHLGQEEIPGILYEGQAGKYELRMLRILSGAGCDVVLLPQQGEEGYRRTDPASVMCSSLELPGMGAFPAGFSIAWLRKEAEAQKDRERICGAPPALRACTNAWIQGTGLADILTPIPRRGEDGRFYYNCFLRMTGVADRLTYQEELYRFREELEQGGRKVVIVENGLIPPSNEEISQIRRKPCESKERLIGELSANLIYAGSAELQKIMRHAFMEAATEEAERTGGNLNRLTSRAVQLLCWLKRYQGQLFQGWKAPQVGCFIYLGGCRNENEAFFFRFLGRLPVDVLILVPDLRRQCCLQADTLYELRYDNSMELKGFPGRDFQTPMATAAYHAERELDSTLYDGSSIFRDQQYQKAVSLTLQSIYEEIEILWKEEARYRPGFAVTDDTVTIPVIFAKVSGIRNGAVKEYWSGIDRLLSPDALLVRGAPFLRQQEPNPIRASVTQFLKNGRLLRSKIKSHPDYAYGMLREEIQEHILDKLQMLLDRRLIRGTYENGTEYTIIATILNLSKNMVRLFQRFDFTKKNPKMIYIHTTDTIIPLEDSILTAFLNLAGFDVVFFIPTGYQCVEKYFNGQLLEEHRIGEFVYDLGIPGFDSGSVQARRSWKDRVFKRG